MRGSNWFKFGFRVTEAVHPLFGTELSSTVSVPYLDHWAIIQALVTP